MLVGESLIVDKTLRMELLSARAESLKLGFEAPLHISIVRSELLKHPPQGDLEQPSEPTRSPTRWPFILKRRS